MWLHCTYLFICLFISSVDHFPCVHSMQCSRSLERDALSMRDAALNVPDEGMERRCADRLVPDHLSLSTWCFSWAGRGNLENNSSFPFLPSSSSKSVDGWKGLPQISSALHSVRKRNIWCPPEWHFGEGVVRVGSLVCTSSKGVTTCNHSVVFMVRPAFI